MFGPKTCNLGHKIWRDEFRKNIFKIISGISGRDAAKIYIDYKASIFFNNKPTQFTKFEDSKMYRLKSFFFLIRGG